jgi:hypothetical protein
MCLFIRRHTFPVLISTAWAQLNTHVNSSNSKKAMLECGLKYTHAALMIIAFLCLALITDLNDAVDERSYRTREKRLESFLGDTISAMR